MEFSCTCVYIKMVNDSRAVRFGSKSLSYTLISNSDFMNRSPQIVNYINSNAIKLIKKLLIYNAPVNR